MSGACRLCARRRWLLGRLSGPLDLCARDPARFWSLLELSDLEIIEAIGGRRRAELRAAHARFEPGAIEDDQDSPSVCRHNRAYPSRLRASSLAPHALGVRDQLERLTQMLDGDLVAIVGTRRASDYGMETARELARGLAACGVTVASGLAEGIPVAVHTGVLEAHGAPLTVMAGGLQRCSPAWCAALYRRVCATGCAISEAPSTLNVHYWCVLGRARTLALLADLVIVVEAEERPSELACAHLARALDKTVAAVPGRVSSRASAGTNSLLMSDARLVRDAQDVLDLLYGVGTRAAPAPSVELEPRLRAVIERVGAGADTLTKLTPPGTRPADIALALTELELRGLLVRGDGGRYVPNVGLTDR